MAKQSMDDDNNLKRRARRRLVGAVALVTAVVVLLPMLLDNEPKKSAQDIELQIPDQDKVSPLEARMPPSVPLEALAAPSVDASSAPVEPPTETVSSGVPAVVEVPTSSSPAATASLSSKNVEKLSSYIVQIGAYSNAESAQQLQKKLGKLGIKVYTEKADDKTRLRAGPYATREAAKKVLDKLEKQGLKPVIKQIQ